MQELLSRFVALLLQGNVCSGMSLRPLLEDWCDSLQSDHMHLVITAPVFIQVSSEGGPGS